MKIYKDGTIECSVEEYLVINRKLIDLDKSKPRISQTINPIIKENIIKVSQDKTKNRPNNQKVTDKQKSNIKTLIETELLSDTQISDRIHLSPQLVNYWRRKLIK